MSKKKNTNPIDIFIVLDRSGSMDTIKSDAIGGYNNFIESQKKMCKNTFVTLVQFNDVIEVLYEHKKIKDVPVLDDKTFVPRHWTALLDAIGTTMVLADKSTCKKVVFAVLTDGLENASKKYKRSQIFDMIKKHSHCGWQFIFLAANQDAIRTGEDMGFSAGSSMSFNPTGNGIRAAYAACGQTVMNYCQTGVVQDIHKT